MSSLRVMAKRRGGKKLQEETEKKQHVIVTENKLFKGFTAKDERNYYQKLSGKFEKEGRYRFRSAGQESFTV